MSVCLPAKGSGYTVIHFSSVNTHPTLSTPLRSLPLFPRPPHPPSHLSVAHLTSRLEIEKGEVFLAQQLLGSQQARLGGPGGGMTSASMLRLLSDLKAIKQDPPEVGQLWVDMAGAPEPTHPPTTNPACTCPRHYPVPRRDARQVPPRRITCLCEYPHLPPLASYHCTH